jgi:hypothetical protein
VRRGTRIGYWWESQRERDHKEDQDVGGLIILRLSTDLIEIRWSGVDWIGLAHDMDPWGAHVNTVMNLRIPQNTEKFFSSCTTGSLSRRAQWS